MIESQRWFQMVATVIGLSVPAACWWIVRPELVHLSLQGSAAMAILVLASFPGMLQVVRLFLPMALARLAPVRDETSS